MADDAKYAGAILCLEKTTTGRRQQIKKLAEAHGLAVLDAPVTLDEAQRHAITKALYATHGNVGEAAAILKVPRSSFYAKLKRFGLNLDDFRRSNDE